jgi:hypothetical protein
MEGMEFVFVELPKFIPANRAERKLRDIWLQFLKEINLGTEVVSEDILVSSEVREALRYLEEGALSPAERAVYDKEQDRIRHEKAAMEGAEEIGLRKGVVIGVAIGEARERAKAEQELAAERAKAEQELSAERAKAEQELSAERAKTEATLQQEKFAIARNLLAAGMEPAFIAQATKLTLDEIQKLSSTLQKQ